MNAPLDPTKLTSVDHNGDRVHLIPAEVRGFFRRHRNWSQAVLLFIFLALPWTTINGHQTIHLNIPDREFSFFGILYRSHDAPLLFFIFATLALGLALVTTLWGRVWCGWACPQTVFIDGVFRRIEQWVEGNYIKRRALKDAPMSFKKFTKKSLKWFLFTVASSLIAHSFMAYFVGAKELAVMTQNNPSENSTYFWLVIFFTSVVLFDFGWFREQFCVIMCPYGRLQSVLLDTNSLAIVYDVKRGEPRRGALNASRMSLQSVEAAMNTQAQGDCVSCNRCVQVCPTGIDIRNGLQMECIACTACVDACDEIMEKVKKPKGLIRYETLGGEKQSYLKLRPIALTLLIVILVSGLSYSVATRKSVDFTLLRGQGLPFSFVQNEKHEEVILNQFRLHITNQGSEPSKYTLSLNDPGVLSINVAENPITLQPGQSREWYFFVKAPKTVFNKDGKFNSKLKLEYTDGSVTESISKELTILGPRP